MYNTIYTIYRTYKEINSKHDMVCIESVLGILLNSMDGKYFLSFDVGSTSYFFISDFFDTEEEAIEFRNKILKGESE